MVSSLRQFLLQYVYRVGLTALLINVLALLAATAVRVGEHEQLGEEGADFAGGAASRTRWLGKVQTWCLYHDEILQCDQDSVILVKSAFKNRQQKADCVASNDAQPVIDCAPNATEKVAAACDGNTRCMMSATTHIACPQSPYTFIRVRYECVSKPDSESNIDESNVIEEDVFVKVGDVGKVAKQDIISTIREEAANPHIEQRYPIGCWRFTWADKLRAFDNPLHRTTCLSEEECFKVFFPGDHRFRRFQYPPTVQYLVHGELVEDKKGGLQKNEDHTWGVCLPRAGGIVYAKMYFFQLKIENAHLLN